MQKVATLAEEIYERLVDVGYQEIRSLQFLLDLAEGDSIDHFSDVC